MATWLRRWQQRILELPILKRLILWSQRTSFPGFGGVPIYYIIDFLYEELQTENIANRANSIAFSFFIALFPLVIFLVTLISFLPLVDVQNYLNALHDSVEPVLPQNVVDFLFDDVIVGVFESQRGDLLSLGFVLTLYFASNGVMSIIQGFEKSYDSFNRRNVVRKRLIAIGLTIVLGLLVIIGVGLLALSEGFLVQVLEWADLSGWEKTGLLMLQWIGILLIIHSILAIIFRYGPSFKERLTYFSPGANLASLFIIITSLGFAYFINRFGTYNKIYGSLGALIVTMLWIKINASVVLIGYELNAAIAVNKWAGNRLDKDES